MSAISNYLPGFPILATGGIDSAEAALQFLQCGASAMQICSSIQNQDFTVVQDYITGLKCALYLKSREDKLEWEFQTPLTRINPDELYNKQGTGLPHFGSYEDKNKALRKSVWLAKDLQSREPVPRAPGSPGKVLALDDLLGAALPRIGCYNDLDNKQQVSVSFLSSSMNPMIRRLMFILVRWWHWSTKTSALTVVSAT